MKTIPGKAQVDRALKGASREVRNATRRVNQEAGKFMARGDYETAQMIVELGRSVRDFQSQVDELRSRWKALKVNTVGPDAGERNEITPVWKLYAPILKTLSANGGTMSWRALEESLTSGTVFEPLSGDVLIHRGRPRWVHSAQRARKEMLKQGFIEKRGSLQWRITPAGRKAAEAST